MVGPMGWFADGYPKISREEYRRLRGPVNPDNLRVYEQGGDERLVPLPQGSLRDRLVQAHLEEAGLRPEDYGFAARSRAVNAGELPVVALFGLRFDEREPGSPHPLGLSGMIAASEEFGKGLAGWDPEKPLLVRLGAEPGAWRAWVLLGGRRWELGPAGSLTQAINQWIEEPDPGTELAGGKAW